MSTASTQATKHMRAYRGVWVNSIAVRGVPHYGIIAGAVERGGTYRAVAAALVLNALAAVALRRSPLFFYLPSWLDLSVSLAAAGAVLVAGKRDAGRTIAAYAATHIDVGIAVILGLAALAVRRLGLYFGLPFNYGVDEPAVVARAWQMLASGDFNPHFFHYPSLGFYLTEAALLLGFLREAAAGIYGALADVPEYVPYYYGRIVSALLSAGSVPALYWLGLRTAGRPAALLASVLLAVSHLSAESGRAAGFHSMTAVPAVLCLIAAVAYLESGERRWMITAGVFAGLGCSMMYYCASLVPMLVLAAVLRPRAPQSASSRVVADIAHGVLAAAFAFVLTTPYALLDLPAFVGGLGERLYIAATRPGWGLGAPGGGTALNIARGYLAAFGVMAAFLFVSGSLRDLIRIDRKRLLLLGYVFLHLTMVGASPSGFGRYFTPAEPIFLLLVSSGLASLLRPLASWKPRLSAPVGALVAASLLYLPARHQLRWIALSRAPLATSAAHAWIEAHSEKDALFLTEPGTPFLPRGYIRRIERPMVWQMHAEECESAGVRYVMISRSIYTRNTENEPRYTRFLNRTNARLLASFEGNDNILNPTIEIYELPRIGSPAPIAKTAGPS